ncbi:hypothetical protein Syun_022906 [Stephania yunnanensis]|uniref:Agenet domain-containing protein n=1 Tax=Stephania yunnanensis TaxID=152371 RepID=A0AAP0FAB9_9MAGN
MHRWSGCDPESTTFQKYVNDARHSSWDPFLCHRLFHEDNLSAFDITHVQGYWKQEILRWMFTEPPDNQLNPNITGSSCADGDDYEAINNRALKRLRKAKARDPVQQMYDKKDVKEAGHEETKLFCNGSVRNREAESSDLKNVKFSIGLSEKKKIKKMTIEKLSVNCHVEVLSQDSGIRGCWFRALVLKRHKDKMKVRYQDIKDVEDEANCLEEWILSSKITVPDELGIWNHCRATVRPEPSCCKGSVSLDLVDSGSIVDAWWNDGWWEGIVVRKESKDNIHVYFPGEKKFSIFGCGDLRLSQDWVLNRWNLVKGRPDLVSSILSGLQTSQAAVGNSVEHLIKENGQCGSLSAAASTGDKKTPGGKTSTFSESQKYQSQSQAGTYAAKVNGGALDLAKGGFLSQINWNSCRKRRSNWDSYPRRNKWSPNSDNRSGSTDIGQEDVTTSVHDRRARYLINADLAKCNYIGDSLLSPSMPLVANLVMSR